MTHAEIAALDCRIVALRRQEWPCKRIAAELGVTTNRVSQGLRRRGATGLSSTVRRARVPGRKVRPMDEEGV